MNESHKIAKKSGREAESYMIRSAVYELSKALYGEYNNNAYEFADHACWLVVEDLMEALNPFGIEVEFCFLGLTQFGYGVESPHDEYFYISMSKEDS